MAGAEQQQRTMGRPIVSPAIQEINHLHTIQDNAQTATSQEPAGRITRLTMQDIQTAAHATHLTPHQTITPASAHYATPLTTGRVVDLITTDKRIVPCATRVMRLPDIMQGNAQTAIRFPRDGRMPTSTIQGLQTANRAMRETHRPTITLGSVPTAITRLVDGRTRTPTIVG